MNKVQKFFIKRVVGFTLTVLAWVARRKYLSGLSNWLTSSLARATIRSKKIKKAQTLEELGKQWQRGFPSAKQVPITQIDEKTVYAEIHTHCPLRGSHDTTACYKMMHYDRKIVEEAGGKFVVLESQAEAGKAFCKVAMRFAHDDMQDLPEAHTKIKDKTK